MADLHSIAHELYGLPLAEFIETRDAWAATERDGGDEQLAKDVRALRKPSATAWAVNLVARTVPALLEELVDLGDQLRQAQASSDGARMRSLDQDRRRLMAQVSAEASAVAEQHDQSLSAAAASGVDETMKAALADPDAGRAVLDGMLVAGLSAPGLGAVDLSDTVAIEPRASRQRPTTPQKAPAKADDDAAEIAAARKAVTAAGREATTAGKAAATARARLDNAEEQSTDLERQLADVTAQVEQLEERLAAARAKVETRQREVESTSAAEADALRALDDAEARVADLEG